MIHTLWQNFAKVYLRTFKNMKMPPMEEQGERKSIKSAEDNFKLLALFVT